MFKGDHQWKSAVMSENHFRKVRGDRLRDTECELLCLLVLCC